MLTKETGLVGRVVFNRDSSEVQVVHTQSNKVDTILKDEERVIALNGEEVFGEEVVSKSIVPMTVGNSGMFVHETRSKAATPLTYATLLGVLASLLQLRTTASVVVSVAAAIWRSGCKQIYSEKRHSLLERTGYVMGEVATYIYANSNYTGLIVSSTTGWYPV